MLGLASPHLASAQPAAANTVERLIVTGDRSSLTAPDTVAATAEIRRTPGAVEVVSDTAFKNTPVQTLKDILGYVPGVIAQPRFGDDARLSIRGSGLSRNYGNRGLSIYMDGVPINTSDGLVDLFEVDPSAYRYVEVFKGANALRYGSNALGGAINLVTPTGRDAAEFDSRLDGGSFGYLKGQASTGGTSGAYDYFVTASGQRADGYREHSDGDQVRANVNVGYRVSRDLETRFYLNASRVRQHIPGEVTKGRGPDLAGGGQSRVGPPEPGAGYRCRARRQQDHSAEGSDDGRYRSVRRQPARHAPHLSVARLYGGGLWRLCAGGR
ncbi:MAG: TonB-dependent receptor plug domain-containing protein [Phenylobacterium sp.]|nr:TonB-dependent receptor plug domain-containing protein [Phenylobacterium sp.]